MSSIDVTVKTFFEHLYVVLGLRTIAPWVNCPCAVTTPTVPPTTISRFPWNWFPRMVPLFFVITIMINSPSNLAESQYPPPPCLSVRFLYITDPIWQQNPLDHCPWFANRAPHPITTPNNTYHPVHTIRIYFNVSLCPCPTHTLHFPKSHAPLRVCFDWVSFLSCCYLRGFVLDSWISDFVFFWRDLWVILVFGILCLFVVHFANFSIFSIFEEFSFWLVCVLSCQLARTLAIASTLVDAGFCIHNRDPPPIHPPTQHLYMQPPSTTHSHTPHGMSSYLIAKKFRNIPLRVAIA